jgi:predicted metal-binding protein
VDKPLEKYKDNTRKYQIKSYKGKCMVCKACSFHNALDKLSIVRFDFEENKFKLIKFNNKYEFIMLLSFVLEAVVVVVVAVLVVVVVILAIVILLVLSLSLL